ncbi:hypothetical protein BH24DEI2_BH24DEI2_01530 [soil metagenome]
MADRPTSPLSSGLTDPMTPVGDPRGSPEKDSLERGSPESGSPESGSHESGSHESGSHESSTVRWRTYQLIFVVTALGMVPLILSSSSYRWETIGILIIVCLGFSALAVAQGVVRRVSFFIERFGLALAVTLYLARYVQVLSGVAVGRYVPEALADMFPWVAVVLTAVFVVLPLSRALPSAIVLLTSISVFGFVVLPSSEPIKGFEPMVDLTVSGAVMILLLSMFRRLVEAGARAEAKAEAFAELANRDGLTGLYNRRYLDRKLAEEFARAARYGRPLSVAVCDLDSFKMVNDRLSHAVGDRTLQQVAQIIRANTRDIDIAARYGGEEFVIVFAETSQAEAVRVCTALCELVAGHAWHELHPQLRVTLSIGVAADLSVENFEKLLHVADLKMYEAKALGKNCVVS